MSRMGRALRWLAALVLVLELAGCQTVQSVGDACRARSTG